MAKTIIAPSILSADFSNLESDIKKFENVKNIWFHLDIMDGHFVPNLTFGTPIIKNLQKLTTHTLDAHFMVTNPELYIDLFSGCRIHNFTFHHEVKTDHIALVQKIKKNYASAGVSIKPKTKVSELGNDLLSQIDLILVMTVEPGFGGQSFMPDCAKKVQELNQIRQKNGHQFQIQVDGGVSNSNARQLIVDGADNLVAGSYIFGHKDYNAAVESLRNF